MKSRKRLIEWGKSLVILLLIFSAFYLLLRSQPYTAFSAGSGENWLTSLLGGLQSNVSYNSNDNSPLLPTIQPVRMVVNNDGSRYGAQYDPDEVDTLFQHTVTLLTEAVNSLEEPVAVTEDTFRDALTTTGLYFEFLSPIPVSALSAWLTSGPTSMDSTHTACQLVLGTDSSKQTVVLYYCNSEDGLFYASAAPGVSVDRLQAALSGYYSNGSFFAFEDASYAQLAPYTLIGVTAPTVGVYTSSTIRVQDNDELFSDMLNVLSFSDQTAYTGSNNSTVIPGGSDSLRITSDGTVSYRAGTDSTRFADCDSLWDTLECVNSILKSTLLEWCGDAQLYLTGLDRTENSMVLTFDYSLDGAIVYRSGISYAAQFTITNGTITEFVLYPRTYTASTESVPVLPQLQAMAALDALGLAQSPLSLRYEDNTAGTPMTAVWVAGR